DARVPPEAVDYVNAHGTGTRQNDAVEIDVLRRVFGRRLARLPLSSTKSQLGHCLGAAGAVEAVATVLALDEGLLPPTVNLRHLDPAWDDLDLVPEAGRRAPLARTGLALGSEFGNLDETATFLDRLFARGAANPLLFPNLVMNASLSYTTIELGLTGPSAMLSAGEVSGEAAIAWGAELVAEGGADVCLAGGTDELCEVVHQVFHEGRLLSPTPRPLDHCADGFALGEGAAVLVLEPLARARARGARVYARLVPVAGFALPAPVHGWPRDSAPLAARLA